MQQTQPQILEDITDEPLVKPRTRLAQSIAAHLKVTKGIPMTAWMIIGKWFSYLLMAATFGLTVAILIKPELLAHVLEWVLKHTATLGARNYVLASGISLIESIPFLNMAVPGQTIAIMIAWYVAQYDFLWILAVVVLSSTIGDAIAYWLGRKYGDYMLAHFGPIFGLNDTMVDKIESLIGKMWHWAVFVSKWNAYTRGFLPFITGTLRMPFWEFMMYNLLGSLMFGSVLVYLAKLFIGHYREVVPYVRWIGLGLMVLMGVWYWWKHGRK